MFSGLENPVHWLVIAAVALLVLGPKRLPEVGRSLGRGIREFKDSISAASPADDEPAPKRELPSD